MKVKARKMVGSWLRFMGFWRSFWSQKNSEFRIQNQNSFLLPIVFRIFSPHHQIAPNRFNTHDLLRWILQIEGHSYFQQFIQLYLKSELINLYQFIRRLKQKIHIFQFSSFFFQRFFSVFKKIFHRFSSTTKMFLTLWSIIKNLFSSEKNFSKAF